MKTLNGILITAGLLLLVSAANAQNGGSDVYWRIDPRVKTCSMVIDPSLTQDQWHTFAKQVGAISSFKSLASAKTLGTLNFHVAIDYGSSPVNQHDPAWINTFVHPDADCPLGDKIAYPTIRAGMGVAENMDVGAYWTVAPGANYGAVGGEFKYAFLRESENLPAAAVRASFTALTGVPDFDLNIYSVDILASKQIALISPYIGIRTNLVVGTATTSKVNLNRESIAVAQGYAGVVCALGIFNLAAEYNVSAVNTFALALGVNI